MHSRTLQKFLPAMQTLQTNRSFTKKDLLTQQFLMEEEDNINMYYAPHNEYINKHAQIVIVGITPGWNQMKVAFEQFVASLISGIHLESCLYQTKIAARFSGSMRSNLTDMLDQCGIPKVFDIPYSSDLFTKSDHLLHTTSIIKYPVFVNEKNYTGHYPSIDHSPLLQKYAYEEFPKELSQIIPQALVIPLGRIVEKVILKLIEEGKLSNHEYLTGFPHPSGANGHRVKQFLQQKSQLRKKIKSWIKRKK